jgi:hypothetical protein
MAPMMLGEALTANIWAWLSGRQEGSAPLEVVVALQARTSGTPNRLQAGVNEASARRQYHHTSALNGLVPS